MPASFGSRRLSARRALLLSSVVIGMVGWQAPAMAQSAALGDPGKPAPAPGQGPDAQPQSTDPKPEPEIVITGTSIKGAAPVGTSVQVLDTNLVKASGLSTTNDVLKSIPQVVNLGYDEGRGGGVQGAQGNVTQARTVNLRGLGVESSLVLLNGRRIPPAGTLGAGYDTSLVPTNAIARVEVVSDGASAIYGSDAVGGVVNLITKTGAAGSETTLRYGFADGFDEKRFGQTFGRKWSTGNIFLAYERYDRGGLLGSDRAKFVTQDLRAGGGPDARSTMAAPGTIIVGTTTYATPTGTNGVGLTGAQFVAGTANKEDINLTRSLLVNQRQHIGFGSFRQELVPGVTFWAEGVFSSRTYDGLGTSLSAGAARAALTVPSSNPFYVVPTGVVAPLCAASAGAPAGSRCETVNFSFSGMGPWRSHGAERAWEIAAGFTFKPFGDWTIDTGVARSGNDAYRKADQLWTFNLAAALADPNPTTALNPFCDPKFSATCYNPATVAKLKGYNIIAAIYRSTDFTAKASGSLFNLPGGNVRLSVGGEYIDSDLLSTITTLTTTATPAPRPIPTGRTVKAGFAEVLVPLFGPDNATPGFYKLELAAAVRVEEFSDFGSTTNPKFGISWSPVQGLTLRGSYGTSYRAPTLANIDYRTSATYSATTLFDSSLQANIHVLQLLGFVQGIKPESATTYTFGGDFAPKFLPGLRLSLTYYNIDYKNRIASTSASTILQNPTLYAAFITRNPTAAQVQFYTNQVYYTSPQENPANFLAIVDARTANIGGLKQSGIDGTISYQFDALGSHWSTGFTFTKILDAKLSNATGVPFTSVLDTINNPISFRGRGSLGWSSNGFRADLFMNITGPYNNNLRTPVERVKTGTTFDASIGYEVPDSGPKWLRGLSFSVSAINVFDQDPPFVINTTASSEGLYDSQNASVVGRFVAFELRKKW